MFLSMFASNELLVRYCSTPCYTCVNCVLWVWQDLKPSLYLKDQEKLRNLEYQLSQPSSQPVVSQSPAQQQPGVYCHMTAFSTDHFGEKDVCCSLTRGVVSKFLDW